MGLPRILFFPVILLASPLWAGTPRIFLHSPLERQVIQRDKDNQAILTIQGTLTPVPSHNTFLTATIRDRQKVLSQEHLPLRSPDFLIRTRLPAGGWYSLELKCISESTPLEVLAVRRVDHVGVGEVFLTAGQSNSANYGDFLNHPRDDRVSAYDIVHQTWRRADDPQPSANGFKGSPWPLFGDGLARTLHCPIGLVSVGVGATSLQDWLPSNNEGYYSRLRTALIQLQPAGIRAVLWHQGETDAEKGTTVQDYHDQLKTIIRALNRETHHSVPWVVANASYLPETFATEEGRRRMEQVRKGQQMLWQDGTALQGPDTDDLVGLAYRWDKIHFNQTGIRIHAQRWFEKIVRHFFEKP